MAINTGDYEVRALTFSLTEQIRANIVLRARDVPMASLYIVTTHMRCHRLKPVGGHFVPDTDHRDVLGTLKHGERIMQSATGL